MSYENILYMCLYYCRFCILACLVVVSFCYGEGFSCKIRDEVDFNSHNGRLYFYGNRIHSLGVVAFVVVKDVRCSFYVLSPSSGPLPGSFAHEQRNRFLEILMTAMAVVLPLLSRSLVITSYYMTHFRHTWPYVWKCATASAIP